MGLVYVNGELFPEHDAAISTFDHGFVVGDGAFETVLLHHGQPFALNRHLGRLNRSLSGLGLEHVDLQEIARAVRAVITSSDGESGRIRITVTAGQGPLGSGRLDTPLTIVVATGPIGEIHETSSVVTVPWARNERGALVGLKTTSYAENAVALAHAHAHDADEAVFGNLAGALCEGSGSNVFVVIDDALITPPLSDGCLAGITRGLVLEYAGGEERSLAYESFRPERLSEAFLTSAIRGVQPISRIDGQPISTGPITTAIMEKFAALRESNIEP